MGPKADPVVFLTCPLQWSAWHQAEMASLFLLTPPEGRSPKPERKCADKFCFDSSSDSGSSSGSVRASRGSWGSWSSSGSSDGDRKPAGDAQLFLLSSESWGGPVPPCASLCSRDLLTEGEGAAALQLCCAFQLLPPPAEHPVSAGVCLGCRSQRAVCVLWFLLW